MKDKELNFKGQNIYIGIDVHKLRWIISIIFQGMLIKRFSMDPNPKILNEYLRKHYPGGNYYSVYEAGFSGYWADRELRELGINNIIVNPADIPTKSKERRRKDDKIDSAKLARELSVGNLEGIYVLSSSEESLRNLVRVREHLKKDQTRQKNRIKSLLNFIGAKLPEDISEKHWSKRYITALRKMPIKEPETKQALNELLDSLESIRRQISRIIKNLREIVYSKEESREIIELLMSVPGVGFITAITLYSEIVDINRFKRLDELAVYVGLSPSVYSSGDKEKTLGLSKQRNKYLRNILIESAWVALRKDPALQMAYGKLRNRMPVQKAIIKISRKLLNRIRHVWIKKEKYVLSVV